MRVHVLSAERVPLVTECLNQRVTSVVAAVVFAFAHEASCGHSGMVSRATAGDGSGEEKLDGVPEDDVHW